MNISVIVAAVAALVLLYWFARAVTARFQVANDRIDLLLEDLNEEPYEEDCE